MPTTAAGFSSNFSDALSSVWHFIVIGGWAVPLWVSVPGAVVTGGLALMLWKEMR